MDTNEFLDFGKAAVEFVANYSENLRNVKVLPDVQPGYLGKLLPEEAPQKPESWQEVLRDVEKHIVPTITHWNSPHFHAFYPAGCSYPSIVGDIISSGLSCVGFSWIASPACTELEAITMNWLGKLLGLPKEFLSSSEGYGGGVIQGSASETTLVCLLAAREETTRRVQREHPEWEKNFIKNKLVAYASDQSNSSVEKGGMLASIEMRLLATDENCSLRGETLLKAIKEDLEKGLIPCCVVATLGTTGTCAFDNLFELGPICNEYNVWLHVDAAYAGAAFVCPEYRHLMSGIEYCDSFNMNAHKWLLVNFDCSTLWLKDSRKLVEAFNVNRIYLDHDKHGIPDYRHWQISLGRRFRAMKLWFVLRLYGVEGLQNYIRQTIKLVKLFESYIKADNRFEIVTECVMALTCFRLKGDNELTKELIQRLNEDRNIYVIPATYKEKLVIRFVVSSRFCEERDISFAWNEITKHAAEIVPPAILADQDSRESFAKSANDIATRIQNLNLESKTQKIS